MFSKLRYKGYKGYKEKENEVKVTVPTKDKENPKICLEFLPNGKVMPRISWEPHSNVNAKLMADVINIINDGKLYDAFRGAVIQQGVISGDIELADAIFKNIKDPKSIEDEKPLIRPGLVTRFHFAQQGQQGQQGENE